MVESQNYKCNSASLLITRISLQEFYTVVVNTPVVISNRSPLWWTLFSSLSYTRLFLHVGYKKRPNHKVPNID